jgi:hypothetical protein
MLDWISLVDLNEVKKIIFVAFVSACFQAPVTGLAIYFAHMLGKRQENERWKRESKQREIEYQRALQELDLKKKRDINADRITRLY